MDVLETLSLREVAKCKVTLWIWVLNQRKKTFTLILAYRFSFNCCKPNRFSFWPFHFALSCKKETFYYYADVLDSNFISWKMFSTALSSCMPAPVIFYVLLHHSPILNIIWYTYLVIEICECVIIRDGTVIWIVKTE